jgi:hypothetical protein
MAVRPKFLNDYQFFPEHRLRCSRFETMVTDLPDNPLVTCINVKEYEFCDSRRANDVGHLFLCKLVEIM